MSKKSQDPGLARGLGLKLKNSPRNGLVLEQQSPSACYAKSSTENKEFVSSLLFEEDRLARAVLLA